LRNAREALHPGEANYRLAIGRFGGFRVAFREGTADEQVIAHSFENDILFSGVPEYQPRSDDVVIDVGVHIGTINRRVVGPSDRTQFSDLRQFDRARFAHSFDPPEIARASHNLPKRNCSLLIT
jgi:hypothetical protein